MNLSVFYRQATAADRDAIWRVRCASIRGLCASHCGEIATEAWAAAPMPDDFAEVIDGRDVLVAEVGGEIVGFGFLNPPKDVLEALFVEPRFARGGIGTAILASLEILSRRAAVRCLKLSASLNAVRFYEVAGYRAVRETTWRHPAGFSLPCVEMIKEI